GRTGLCGARCAGRVGPRARRDAAGVRARASPPMASEQRGPALTTFAVLFGVLAVSNLLKPLQMGGPEHTGFVFFGQRMTGTANAILGPLFGIYLLVYALGIWRLRRFALPMAYAYAAYVIVNLIAFTVRGEAQPGVGYVVFSVIYALVAIGVSGGAALVLSRRKAALG